MRNREPPPTWANPKRVLLFSWLDTGPRNSFRHLETAGAPLRLERFLTLGRNADIPVGQIGGLSPSTCAVRELCNRPARKPVPVFFAVRPGEAHPKAGAADHAGDADGSPIEGSPAAIRILPRTESRLQPVNARNRLKPGLRAESRAAFDAKIRIAGSLAVRLASRGQTVLNYQPMEAARVGLLSVDDYLSGEPASEVRHEYVAGAVHAMAGASEENNGLTLNLASALRSHLRGSPGKVFVVDMKVRLVVGREEIFYYPDVLVTCDARDTDRHFKRFPKVVVEVLSPETERTDRREKFLAYRGIETVEEYVLVAQDRMEVTVFRRAAQWQPEVQTKPTEELTLRSIEFKLDLAAVYDGVKV